MIFYFSICTVRCTFIWFIWHTIFVITLTGTWWCTIKTYFIIILNFIIEIVLTLENTNIFRWIVIIINCLIWKISWLLISTISNITETVYIICCIIWYVFITRLNTIFRICYTIYKSKLSFLWTIWTTSLFSVCSIYYIFITNICTLWWFKWSIINISFCIYTIISSKLWTFICIVVIIISIELYIGWYTIISTICFIV